VQQFKNGALKELWVLLSEPLKQLRSNRGLNRANRVFYLLIRRAIGIVRLAADIIKIFLIPTSSTGFDRPSLPIFEALRLT
jgi:hypothetical protein